MSEAVDDLEQPDVGAVEAALALLDEYLPLSEPLPELSDPSVASWMSSPLEELHIDTDDAFDDCVEVTNRAQKRSRKKYYKPEVEKMRRQRKRSERQELKRRVEQLEHQLAAAKDRVTGCRAMNRRDRLTIAQELNRQLKTAISAHSDVSECVRRLLSELSKTTHTVLNEAGTLAFANMQALSERPERFRPCAPYLQLSRAAHSAHRAARLAINSAFGAVDHPGMLKSTRVVPVAGNDGYCLETETTTPLACDLRSGTQLFHDWVAAKRGRKIGEISYSTEAVDHRDRLTEARGIVNFENSADASPWHCVYVSETYEEADRFVRIGVMAVAHPSETVSYREEAWTVIARSPIDPLHQSILRIFYRLTMKHDAAKPREQVGDPLRIRLARQSMCKMTDVRRALLRGAGQTDLCALLDV